MRKRGFADWAHLIVWSASYIYFIVIILTAIFTDYVVTNNNIFVGIVYAMSILTYETKLNRN